MSSWKPKAEVRRKHSGQIVRQGTGQESSPFLDIYSEVGTSVNPVFAMDEAFSINRGSRLACGLSHIRVDQNDPSGAILQPETS